MSDRSHEQGVLQVIGDRKILFATVFVLFVSLVVTVSLKMEPVYEATAVLLLETNRPQDKMSLLRTQYPMFGRSEIQNEIQILNSLTLHAEVAERLLDQEGLATDPGERRSRIETLQARQLQGLRVRPVEGSQVVEIRFRTGEPTEAARVANAVADVYVDMSKQRAREEILQIKEFLAEQVVLLHGRVSDAGDRLLHYQEENQVASLPDETKVLVEQLATFESAYHKASAELEGRRKELSTLNEQLADARESLESQVPIVTGPVINQLRANLAESIGYQAKFLSQGYSADHQKMRELDHQINEIKRQLNQATGEILGRKSISADPLGRIQTLLDQILVEEVEVFALEARSKSLKEVVWKYKTKLNNLPEKSYEMAQLERSAGADEKLLSMLMERYEEARIAEAGLVGSARIIDSAMVPRKPIRPNHPLNILFGVLFGLAIASASCLVAHRFHRKVETSRELHHLVGLPILGRIPPINVRDIREAGRALRIGPLKRMKLSARFNEVRSEGCLILSLNPWSQMIEAYRRLRANLEHGVEETPRTLLITSPTRGDGKTTTTTNLALILASSAGSVLVIDADTRHPKVASRYRIRPERGLEEVLAGRASLSEAVVSAPFPNLSVLSPKETSQRATELLFTPQLASLLKEARRHYDYVLVDAPPLIAVSDPMILATAVEATLLVVRAGRTERDAVRQAVSILRSVNARIGGIVFNDERDRMTSKRYYQYVRSDKKGHSNNGRNGGAPRLAVSRRVDESSTQLGSPATGTATGGAMADGTTTSGASRLPRGDDSCDRWIA